MTLIFYTNLSFWSTYRARINAQNTLPRLQSGYNKMCRLKNVAKIRTEYNFLGTHY